MGRPAQIGRAAILDTALKIADDYGLDAVTMHAVARRLQVTPMALYRHVASKAALLDGLVETLLTETPLPPRALPWDEFLTALAAAIRATARRHPAAFPLLLSRPAITPAAVSVRDAIHQALRRPAYPRRTLRAPSACSAPPSSASPRAKPPADSPATIKPSSTPTSPNCSGGCASSCPPNTGQPAATP